MMVMHCRLQNMVSRYNDVDPEEHRLLKVKLDEVTQAEAEASQLLKARTAELAEREGDLKAARATAEVCECV